MNSQRLSKPTIFFSHAHTDSEIATEIKNWIDDALLGAVDFFISSDKQSVALGAEWSARVREALDNSAIFVVILSPRSLHSSWIYFEAGAGYIRKLPVVPVCVGGLRIRDLQAPLSLLQATELPSKEGAAQLLDLIAKSAGLRTPKSVPDLALPETPTDGKVGILSPADSAPSASSVLDEVDALTKAQAIKLLGSYDKTVVTRFKDVLEEALYVMQVPSLEGNISDPTQLIDGVRAISQHPVLISKDALSDALEEMEKVRRQFPPPKEDDYLHGYNLVRAMLSPLKGVLPSSSDYEELIYEFPPGVYVPGLVIKLVDTMGRPNWQAISLLANTQYGRFALPVLAQVIAGTSPRYWEAKQTATLARLVLGNSFDAWYAGIRGRSYLDDVRFEEERERQEEEARRREYIRLEEEQRHRERKQTSEEV